ncbi:MAG: thiamine phosphate synthase [Candidatus Nanopelagicales bacterium]
MKTRIDRVARLARARLYCCTGARTSLADFEDFVNAIYEGGVDIVQFRDKTMEAGPALAHLELLRRAADRHAALACVNDRADLAVIAGMDVVHVGQDDLTPAQARSIVGADMLIGRSTHAIAEAAAAADDDDVDYFAVGPVWPTPTKPGRAAPGLQLVREVSSREFLKPWFAIGGIDVARVQQVRDAGARRIVVVRALTEPQSPTASALGLRSAIVG